jgi:hypothetical protein
MNSVSELWKIARELYYSQVHLCESVSVELWQLKRWPNDPGSFKIIDSMLNHIYVVERCRGKFDFSTVMSLSS